MPPQPPLDRLLEHRLWVRNLVRTCVRDPGAADDVEQQVWLSALESAPADVERPRAWLAAVARNWIRRGHRGASRRARRETAAARPEAQPSTAELVATADAHRRVVVAVLALSPALRDAVLLHYFEGLPVADVASRLGAPHETVRSRLRLARDRLRDALSDGRDASGRPAFGAAMLAVACLPRDGATAAALSVSVTGGTLAMTAAQKVAFALVVPLAAGVAFVTARASAPEPETTLTVEEARALVARVDRLEKARDASAAGASEARGLTRRVDALETAVREAEERAAAAPAPATAAKAAAPAPRTNAGGTAPTLPDAVKAALTEIAEGLRSEPGSAEHAAALARLAEYLVKAGGPPPEEDAVRAATALLTGEARGFRVSADEAAALAPTFERLPLDHAARPGLAVAVGSGWARDDRLDGFLASLPATREPDVHTTLLRVLDHRPSRGFGAYVLRLLRDERDPQVVRSALDADRIAAAGQHVPALQLIQAAEARLADAPGDAKSRRTAVCAVGVAALADRDAGVPALERIRAGETDPAFAARIDRAIELVRKGGATSREIEDLLR